MRWGQWDGNFPLRTCLRGSNTEIHTIYITFLNKWETQHCSSLNKIHSQRSKVDNIIHV